MKSFNTDCELASPKRLHQITVIYVDCIQI